MEDAAIIALYWERNQDAIEQSRQKYGAYCLTVSRNILDSREDAEELSLIHISEPTRRS